MAQVRPILNFLSDDTEGSEFDRNYMREQLLKNTHINAVPIEGIQDQRMGSFDSTSSMGVDVIERALMKDYVGETPTVDDIKVLADMGYSTEEHKDKKLFRGFNNFMSFAFCFTAVSVMPSISVGFKYGLQTGGPSVMVWGWIISSIFTIFVGYAMAEICSVYPSAGSVYHWAGQLATKEWAPFCSFFCGWFNLVGNAAGDAAFAYGFATILSATVTMGTGRQMNTEDQVWMSVAVIAAWSLMNIARTDQQGWLNNIAVVFQLLASFAIVMVVLVMAPDRASASYVFGGWNDLTGFNSESGVDSYAYVSYVCVVGLLSALFGFSGYEAGAHMAEETADARTGAPMGVIYTTSIGAVFGLVYILGMLFATPDVNVPLQSSSPITAIYQACAGLQGGLVLSCLLLICLFFAGMSSTTVTSRIFFAMVRDGAIPGKKYLYHINPITKSPLMSVLVIFFVDTFLLLLPLINSTALNAIISTTTIGFQISYAIPILLRVTASRDTFVQGVVNNGKYSLFVGWVASLWLIITSLIFFLPSSFPVTTENMNWTVIVVSGVFIGASLYWFYSARYFFVGPVRMDDCSNSMLKPEETESILYT